MTGDFDEQTAERIASGLTKPLRPDPRRHSSVCTRADLEGSLPPLPPYRRLAAAGTYWFGRVRLTPATGAQPTFSEAQAWGVLGSDLFGAGSYHVVLARWTSDAGLVMQSNGRPVPHDHVPAWVVIGTHVPVAASDVSGGATAVRGVPCYFGTSIAAVDATNGREIASAWDYSG